MPDYKRMYVTLFNRVTDTIEQLKEVQRVTEDLYVDAEHEMHVLPPPGEEK